MFRRVRRALIQVNNRFWHVKNDVVLGKAGQLPAKSSYGPVAWAGLLDVKREKKKKKNRCQMTADLALNLSLSLQLPSMTGRARPRRLKVRTKTNYRLLQYAE